MTYNGLRLITAAPYWRVTTYLEGSCSYTFLLPDWRLRLRCKKGVLGVPPRRKIYLLSLRPYRRIHGFGHRICYFYWVSPKKPSKHSFFWRFFIVFFRFRIPPIYSFSITYVRRRSIHWTYVVTPQYGAAVINRSPLYVITAYERTKNSYSTDCPDCGFPETKKKQWKIFKIAVFWWFFWGNAIKIANS